MRAIVNDVYDGQLYEPMTTDNVPSALICRTACRWPRRQQQKRYQPLTRLDAAVQNLRSRLRPFIHPP